MMYKGRSFFDVIDNFNGAAYKLFTNGANWLQNEYQDYRKFQAPTAIKRPETYMNESYLRYPNGSLNLKDTNGKTPLMNVIEKGDWAMVQSIIARDDTDLSIRDKNDKTAADYLMDKFKDSKTNNSFVMSAKNAIFDRIAERCGGNLDKMDVFYSDILPILSQQSWQKEGLPENRFIGFLRMRQNQRSCAG